MNIPLIDNNFEHSPMEPLSASKKKKSFKEMSNEEIEGYGDIN
jgi:hypothetical protein